LVYLCTKSQEQANNNNRIALMWVKLLRDYGGCLGSKSRRRA
jgi:hypothetical protein